MNPIITQLVNTVAQKLIHHTTIIVGGVLLAMEISSYYFMPCLLATLLDILSAFFLNRRLSKKYPGKADGKFKSGYKMRIMMTMLIAFMVLILASYVDIHVLKDNDMAVRSAMGIFLFYQTWSILENWSSENENKLARALQRIMVNKAERHLNIPLSDIMLKEETKPTKLGENENNQ